MVGVAYSKGLNTVEQLDYGNTTDRSVAVLVSGAPAFVALSAGALRSSDRTTSGAVLRSGSHSSGRFGHGDFAFGLPAIAARGICLRSL